MFAKGKALFFDVLINSVIASRFVSRRVRWRALRALGMDLDGCGISPGYWFSGRSLKIGRDSFISRGASIETAGQVTIGRNVAIGHQVMITTSSHKLGPSTRRAAQAYGLPVTIEDGAWLGARVTVLPGVTIGAGSMVAAGAVVVSDLAPDGLYGGVPAKLIRILEPETVTLTGE